MLYFVYTACAVVLALIGYVCMPILSFGFAQLPMFFMVAGGMLIGIGVMKRANYDDNNKGIIGAGAAIVVLCFMYILGVGFFNSEMLNAAKYRALIGEVKKGIFSTDVSPIDITNSRFVDHDMAKILGDKKLHGSMGSQAEFGDYTLQKVGNGFFWIAPLLHSGFFAWNSNSQGTSAYVMVSASNPNDVRLVEKINDKPIRIKYQPNAFFGDDLARHIYMSGYASVGITDYSFEIDDDGYPYYVVTTYKNSIGFSGEEATGVLVVDVMTGEIKQYSMKDVPAWVDRVEPEEFIRSQISNWGEYADGFLNPSNNEKMKLTHKERLNLIYGEDGRAYWYAGLTSVGKDTSMTSFILIDSKTKEVKRYELTGAQEERAMASAEGKVQNLGYKATFPNICNIAGIPTYLMALKDKEGLPKMVAMVSIEDYSVVGVGNNASDALRDYKNALSSKGNSIAPSSAAKAFKITTTVLRITNNVRSGNSSFYMVLAGHENKIFVATTDTSPEVAITKEGDKVEVVFDESGDHIVDAKKFRNLKFVLEKTEAQIGIEIRDEAVHVRKDTKKEEKNTDASWERLTPQEKAELMKNNKKK